MATRNVTVSLDEVTYKLLKSAAETQQQSLSGVLARAVRHVAMQESGRRYDEWFASQPEVREALDDWDQMAARSTDDWDDLTSRQER
ncbi:MAG: hypothetical protein ACRDTU_23420 [Micromonosporaceae bacterium]